MFQERDKLKRLIMRNKICIISKFHHINDWNNAKIYLLIHQLDWCFIGTQEYITCTPVVSITVGEGSGRSSQVVIRFINHVKQGFYLF